MLRLPALAILATLTSELVAQTTAPADVTSTLEESCYDCHSGTKPKAGLNLATLDLLDPRDRLGVVLTARNRVEGREMPPADYGTLDAEETAVFVRWAEETLRAGIETIELNPGWVAVRRLSRTEYDHSIRDLFGVVTDRSAKFPAESVGYGFDNIGDGADFSTLHIEKYYEAAADVARRIIDVVDPNAPPVVRISGSDAEIAGGGHTRGEIARLYAYGSVIARFDLPREGEYRLELTACGDQAGSEPVRLRLMVDGERIDEIEVPQTPDQPGTFEFDLKLDEPTTAIEAIFVNDYYRPDHPDPKQRDRNMVVNEFALLGPLDERRPRGSEWLLEADPGPSRSARERYVRIARALATRAWRQPAARKDVHRLADLAAEVCEDGSPFGYGVRAMVEAVLISPRFLCRTERPGTRPLTSFELASRLSYFIWSSVPDEKLLELAERDTLSDTEALRRQAIRMLDDPRASALATNFGAQWLELRNLDDVSPDPDRFPTFDRALRSAMQRETELVFEAVLREKRSVYDLVDANFTFVNGLLAAHYGIEHVTGTEFRRVRAPREGGILGHASVLTVTSNPTRTSPVKRGKWLLDNLLDSPPPPPEPGFDSFEDEAAAEHPVSLREQLARHRKDPQCAACHERMDALGLALERFDAVGTRRELFEGKPIDASGSLPGGREIEDLSGLCDVLDSNPAFLRCVLRKMFVFAVGRDTSLDDRLALERLRASLPGVDTTLHDVVLGIVSLPAFRELQDETKTR